MSSDQSETTQQIIPEATFAEHSEASEQHLVSLEPERSARSTDECWTTEGSSFWSTLSAICPEANNFDVIAASALKFRKGFWASSQTDLEEHLAIQRIDLITAMNEDCGKVHEEPLVAIPSLDELKVLDWSEAYKQLYTALAVNAAYLLNMWEMHLNSTISSCLHKWNGDVDLVRELTTLKNQQTSAMCDIRLLTVAYAPGLSVDYDGATRSALNLTMNNCDACSRRSANECRVLASNRVAMTAMREYFTWHRTQAVF